MEYSQQQVVDQFFSLSNELRAQNNIGARDVCNRMVEFFKSTRVENTNLDECDDMLLLQWGASQPLKSIESVDFRFYHGKVEFEKEEYTYLDFTRQIFSHEDEDIDFDAEAIQLSITLIYVTVKENEHIRGSNLWINTPMKIIEQLDNFYQVPFVIGLIDQPVTKMITTLDMPG